MSITFDFTGQVALVTGASAGMGAATARGFAASAVVLADRDGEAAASPARELTDSGRAALAVACDVSNAGELAVAVRAAVSARR